MTQAGGSVRANAYREMHGQLVREEWIKWAREQDNPKPSWLVPWEELSEPEREVDRRIGEVLFGTGYTAGWRDAGAAISYERGGAENAENNLLNVIVALQQRGLAWRPGHDRFDAGKIVDVGTPVEPADEKKFEMLMAMRDRVLKRRQASSGLPRNL